MPEILGYGRVFLIGNRSSCSFLEARDWPQGRPRPSVLILIMLVSDHVLPVVLEPRPEDPRGERPVTRLESAPARPAGPVAGRRPRARGAGPSSWIDPDGSSRSGCAATRFLVYLFLYLPIVVVVVFSFNGTDRRVTELGRLQPEVVRVRPHQQDDPELLLQQLRRGDRDGDHLDDLRDDGRPRPPAGAEVVRPALRGAHLRLDHRARDRDRPRHARLLLDDRGTS